jgi:hypothetical protein
MLKSISSVWLFIRVFAADPKMAVAGIGEGVTHFFKIIAETPVGRVFALPVAILAGPKDALYSIWEAVTYFFDIMEENRKRK